MIGETTNPTPIRKRKSLGWRTSLYSMNVLTIVRVMDNVIFASLCEELYEEILIYRKLLIGL